MIRKNRHKYEQLADDLERTIYSDYQPGNQFISEMEICTRYQCNRQTVHKAILNLADRGLLIQKGRGGTYVADYTNGAYDDRLTAVSMPVKTHLWNELYLHMSSAAMSYDQLLLTIDISMNPAKNIFDNDVYPKHLQTLKKALQFRPRNLIYGAVNNLESLFEDLKGDKRKFRNLILLSDQDTSQFDVDHIGIVSPDYRDIWRVITENAFRSEYRNLAVFVPTEQEDIALIQAEIGAVKSVNKIENGTVEFFVQSDPDSLDNVVSYCSSGVPTAVLTNYDFGAHLIKGAILLNGNLNIPEQVGIYGVYNTPWAESDSLTSVGFEPEIWTKMIFQCIQQLNDGESIVKLKVPSKLFQRSSTRGIQ